MAELNIPRTDILKPFHKQINAVIAKALDFMENTEEFYLLHPTQLDALRHRIFEMAWECYKVGYGARKRLEEYENI